MTALPPKPLHNFNPLRFSPPAPITEDERRRLIEKAAYLRAERRGFSAGHEVADWMMAEADVDAQLSRSHLFTTMW